MMTPEIPKTLNVVPSAPPLNPALQAQNRIAGIGTALMPLLGPAAVVGLTIAGLRTMLGFPPPIVKKIIQPS